MCPLPAYTPGMGGGGLHRDDLIAGYFAQGFAYKDILVALLVSHGLSVSLKTLKRTLRRLGLRRRQPLCRDQLIDAIELIQIELKGSGQCIGYRSMWKRLQNKGLVVSANSVREVLKFLDEEGVRERKIRRLKRRDYVSLDLILFGILMDMTS